MFSLLWYCFGELLGQLPRFKIPPSVRSFTLASEMQAALVECAVNKFESIPDEPKMTFTKSATF